MAMSRSDQICCRTWKNAVSFMRLRKFYRSITAWTGAQWPLGRTSPARAVSMLLSSPVHRWHRYRCELRVRRWAVGHQIVGTDDRWSSQLG